MCEHSLRRSGIGDLRPSKIAVCVLAKRKATVHTGGTTYPVGLDSLYQDSALCLLVSAEGPLQIVRQPGTKYRAEGEGDLYMGEMDDKAIEAIEILKKTIPVSQNRKFKSSG